MNVEIVEMTKISQTEKEKIMEFIMSNLTKEMLEKYRELRKEYNSYFSDEEFNVNDDTLLYTALSFEVEKLEELLANKDILEGIKAKRRV